MIVREEGSLYSVKLRNVKISNQTPCTALVWNSDHTSVSFIFFALCSPKRLVQRQRLGDSRTQRCLTSILVAQPEDHRVPERVNRGAPDHISGMQDVRESPRWLHVPESRQPHRKLWPASRPSMGGSNNVKPHLPLVVAQVDDRSAIVGLGM